MYFYIANKLLEPLAHGAGVSFWMSDKKRRGIQRKSAPVNTRKPASEDARDHVMTSEEFAKWKPTLMRTLRRAGDPPPRTMNHGRGSVSASGQFTRNVRDLLAKNATRGSVLVRGFKLMHIRLNQNKWGSWGGQNAWKASFHLVVAHPPSERGSTWFGGRMSGIDAGGTHSHDPGIMPCAVCGFFMFHW